MAKLGILALFYYTKQLNREIFIVIALIGVHNICYDSTKMQKYDENIMFLRKFNAVFNKKCLNFNFGVVYVVWRLTHIAPAVFEATDDGGNFFFL